MSGEDLTFDDVLEDIGSYDGSDLEQTESGEAEVDTAVAEATADDLGTQDGPSEEDKPVEDPEPSAEEEDAPVAEAEGEEEAATEPPSEEPTTEEQAPLLNEMPDDTVVMVLEDGTKLTAGELRNGGLRQADYTRKTQHLAQVLQQAQNAVDRGKGIVQKILGNETAQEFLKEHPEALDLMLKNPDQAEAMLSNPAALDRFWQQYEALADDPQLAQALVDRSQSQQAVQQLELVTRANAVSRLGRDVAAQIAEVGEQFEGVDANEVTKYVLEMVGVTPQHLAAARQNPLILEQPMAQLYSLLVRRDPNTGQEYLDNSIIRDRYEVLKARAEQAAAKSQQEVTEQSEATREKLAESDQTPPSPDGSAPSAQRPDQEWEEYKASGATLEDFLADDPLLGKVG